MTADKHKEILVCDRLGRVQLANAAASARLGIDLNGTLLPEWVTDPDALLALLCQDKPGEVGLRWRTPAGHWDSIAKVTPGEGLYLLELYAEDGLDAQLLQVLELIPIPMNLVGLNTAGQMERDSNIEYVNPAFTRLLGYLGEDLPNVSTWLRKLYPDETYRNWVIQEGLRRAANGETRGADFMTVWMTGKDGRRHLCQRLSSRYGNKLLVSLYDLSERHAAEEALKANEAKTRQFLDALPIGVSIMGFDYRLQYVNRKAIELQGKGIDPDADAGDLAEVYQAYLRDTDTLYPMEQMPLVRALAGESVTVDDMEIQHPDRRVPIQIWGSPVYDEQGQVSCAIVAFSDISERLRFQAALQQAKAVAEAANRTKSEFLANMSHEIRTPMNAIIGLNHLLEKSGLSPKQSDYVHKIQASAQNLLRVINDILDFSKIEAGRLDLENVPFDLNQVLATLSTLLSLKAHQKGLELIFDLRDPAPTRLIGDSLRLEQVLLNLVNNAIKFTETGSVTVAVGILAESPQDVLMRFSISDTGIGLSTAQQQRLFQAFSQADSSITRQYGGTGLGLTISKRLAEIMGGEIGVESSQGKGSTFWFSARFSKQPERSLPKSIPTEIHGLQALVVDDQVHALEIISDYLRGFGMQVLTASSGHEALHLLQSDQPQIRLVLLDWKMPGLNGVETLKLLRSQLPSDRQPAVILMTAYGREDLMYQIERVVVDGILLKPLTPSMVYDAILEALDLAPIPDVALQPDAAWRAQLKPYCGARLLLVEDNPINQQVAQELLESEGFYVRVAQHGREALELLAAHSFHLVLMDLQMPVMDGYTATRKIREQPQWATLSVIAMTADAVTGVREQVLAAGMNDCVTKPIQMDELFETLICWLPKPEDLGPLEPPQQRRRRAEQFTSLPDLPGINLPAALRRVSDDQAFYLGLLVAFCRDYASFPADYLALTPGERYRYIHTLTGVTGNLGMEALHLAAKALESELKPPSGLVSEASSAYAHFAKLLRKMLKMLSELQPSTQALTPNSDATLNLDELTALEAELELFDAAAERRLARMSGLPVEPHQALRQALEHFDFESALALVRELKLSLEAADEH